MVVSNIFDFHPLTSGGDDPIWRLHIFQGGWFNHQLGLLRIRIPGVSSEDGPVAQGMPSQDSGQLGPENTNDILDTLPETNILLMVQKSG